MEIKFTGNDIIKLLSVFGAVALLAWIIQLLWNNCLVGVVNVNEIGFFQSLGVYVLIRILFGPYKINEKRDWEF